jgi:hypothetical protein
MRPIGWVHEYVADLPLVEGTSVREYKLPLSAFWRAYTAPDSDELKPAPLSPLLTIETSEKTGRTFTQLLSLNNDRVALASKRLNFCMLRIKEEDAILDAIIAMEAILSDESTTEVIHKLASRMAALTQLAGANNMQPVEVFHEVKKIYDYRSGVVHGNKKKVEKNRELTRHSGSKIRSLQAAIEYLRLALTILIDNPEYLSATKIDEELLLGKLGSQPVAANS